VPLSLQTDYALRILIYLAGRPERTQIGQVAGFYRISVHHVAKVANQLARWGYLRSVRGIGGGIELARRPEDIRVGEVVQASEGKLHLLECVGTENVCVIQPACKLRGVLARAEQLQMDYLNSVRLSDVVRPAGQLVDLLPLAARPRAPQRAGHVGKSLRDSPSRLRETRSRGATG
jgi:Rrf2 family nitric oxide-sensitive transcriptional repressor